MSTSGGATRASRLGAEVLRSGARPSSARPLLTCAHLYTRSRSVVVPMRRRSPTACRSHAAQERSACGSHAGPMPVADVHVLSQSCATSGGVVVQTLPRSPPAFDQLCSRIARNSAKVPRDSMSSLARVAPELGQICATRGHLREFDRNGPCVSEFGRWRGAQVVRLRHGVCPHRSFEYRGLVRPRSRPLRTLSSRDCAIPMVGRQRILPRVGSESDRVYGRTEGVKSRGGQHHPSLLRHPVAGVRARAPTHAAGGWARARAPGGLARARAGRRARCLSGGAGVLSRRAIHGEGEGQRLAAGLESHVRSSGRRRLKFPPGKKRPSPGEFCDLVRPEAIPTIF